MERAKIANFMFYEKKNYVVFAYLSFSWLNKRSVSSLIKIMLPEFHRPYKKIKFIETIPLYCWQTKEAISAPVKLPIKTDQKE